MTREQNEILSDALDIISELAERNRGERRDQQNDWDRAGVALDEALTSERIDRQ